MQITQQHIDWWQALTPIWKEIFIEHLYAQYDDYGEIVNELPLDLIDVQQDLARLFAIKDIHYNYVAGMGGFAGFGYDIIDNIPDLSYFYQLEKINLSDNPIKDLSGIANNTSLKEIWLYYADTPNLDKLAKLKNLEVLTMPYSNLKDIQGIRHCKNLIECDFSYVETDFSVLAELPHLTELWLDNCNIHNIEFLANLNHLENLNLESNPISDLTPLYQLTQLKSLDIINNDVPFSDEQIAELKRHLPNCDIRI